MKLFPYLCFENVFTLPEPVRLERLKLRQSSTRLQWKLSRKSGKTKARCKQRLQRALEVHEVQSGGFGGL
jgi:hypothetical protein